MGDVCLAIGAARIIFGMPFRGNLVLFLVASALYTFVGIGMGMMLGSMCHSQRQAQLVSFFINIPLILLSGTVVPLDTMPWLLQTLSLVDPLRYYTLIARGVILKGATLAMVWQQLALLAVSAIVVLTVSANRFRRQLV
jgi:ABC-2 type transport system permease protein